MGRKLIVERMLNSASYSVTVVDTKTEAWLWRDRGDLNSNPFRRAIRMDLQQYGFDSNEVESILLSELQRDSEDEDNRNEITFTPVADLQSVLSPKEWLIKDALLRNNICICGGPKKSMKTSIMMDLALSLSSGKPFLNTFEVAEKSRVGFVSLETADEVFYETAMRIAASKGLRRIPKSCLASFEPVRLGSRLHNNRLADLAQKRKLDVLIVDPVYLCLTKGTNANPADIFSIGPLLYDLARIFKEIGCTLILCHHYIKGKQTGEPQLHDLSYAGFQEVARQWMLVCRKSEYRGKGMHDLWITIGSSAGFDGMYSLEVDEGTINKEGVRSWSLKLEDELEYKQRELNANRLRRAIDTTVTILSSGEKSWSDIRKMKTKMKREDFNAAIVILQREKLVTVSSQSRSGNDTAVYSLVEGADPMKLLDSAALASPT